MQNFTHLACICHTLQAFFLSSNTQFIMKVNLFALCITMSSASVLFATNGRGQDLEKTRVVLSLDDASLYEALMQIEKQSDFRFTYKEQEIGEYSNLWVEKDRMSVRACLDLLLQDTHLEYKQIGNYIVLTEKRPEAQRAEATGSQDFTVSGNVRDDAGQPLPGVNVIVRETTLGTVTDSEGNYSINAPDERGILVFSFIGYSREEVPINGRSVIDIVLAEDLRSLEEVVVVGYGTQRKSDLTGSIASVSEEELTAYPATNALQALQGRAAGVTVQSTNGDPGGDFRIRVRGASSINASSDPLFVVDGLVGGILPPPEDIASIEVLKDASASAIYGSRGANGVVMITTKSGEPGKTVININSSYSSQEEIGRVDVLNARDFAEYINEARNVDFYDLNALEADTDWQELIFQPGHIQNHQLSMSGGNDKVQYYVSGVYFDHKGVIKTSAFDRYSLTTNLRFKVSDNVRIILNSALQGLNRDGVSSQTSGGVTNSGAVTAANRFDPTQGILDENGVHTLSQVGIAAFENPMAVIYGREEENRSVNIQTNLKAEIDITKGLVFNSTFGTIVRNHRNGVYNNRISNSGYANNGLASLNYRKNMNFLTEQYLNYDFKSGGKNNFLVTAGYSYQNFSNESFGASNAGFISDALGFWNLSAGTVLQAPESNTTASEIASFYGRVNYNFDERYLITVTGRYDGASQFSEGNKWSFFPSGAFSWNISNEGFFPQNNLVTALKLRTSYGLTGNQGIGPYASLARISPTFFLVNGALVNSVRPTAIANKDLTWETTAQLSMGLDFEFFDGRINLTGEYYEKKTSDLLFQVPIPPFSGFQERLENLGEIVNKGFEFQISSRNLVSAVRWNTSFNLTLNRNKVVSLPDGVDIIYASAPHYVGAGQTSILREGEPVGSFYGYVYEGVYQEGDQFIPGGAFETQPGGEKFADLNDDGVLDSDDRRIIGDPNPDAVWGLNNDFSYKGLHLNIFLQAFTGGDMLNFVRMELERLSGNSNATTAALRRWSPENTNTDVPKAFAGRVARTSTRFVEDGSYIRLKNISIGYDFPSALLSKLKIRTARLYLSGQNLLTFTEYSGVDPEVGYGSNGTTNSNRNLGLDYDSYPNTKSYTLGINLGF